MKQDIEWKKCWAKLDFIHKELIGLWKNGVPYQNASGRDSIWQVREIVTEWWLIMTEISPVVLGILGILGSPENKRWENCYCVHHCYCSKITATKWRWSTWEYEWIHKVINIYFPGKNSMCLEHFSHLGLINLKTQTEQLALHIVLWKNKVSRERDIKGYDGYRKNDFCCQHISNMLLYLISLWSNGSRCSSFPFRTLPVKKRTLFNTTNCHSFWE